MRVLLSIAIVTIITVGAVLLFGITEESGAPSPAGPEVVVPPVQTPVRHPDPWMKKTYRITPLAEYSITAKVLGIEYYRYGREANLSPVDFALGWGPMSDTTITRYFTVSQKDRWCTWRSKGAPISIQEVLLHSANVHMVPPNEAIMHAMGEVALGDIIRIRGKLIQAQGSDGWTWTSSLVRNDQGERSCEIIWVDQLEILSPPAL